GDDLVVEDLESTNGTFVNDKRVTRQPLRRGDVIAIGKHTLLVERVSGDAPAGGDAAKGLMSNPGDTIFLDAKKHQALLAMLRDADVFATSSGATSARISAGTFDPNAPYAARANTGNGMPYFVPGCELSRIGMRTIVLPSRIVTSACFQSMPDAISPDASM